MTISLWEAEERIFNSCQADKLAELEEDWPTLAHQLADLLKVNFQGDVRRCGMFLADVLDAMGRLDAGL